MAHPAIARLHAVCPDLITQSAIESTDADTGPTAYAQASELAASIVDSFVRGKTQCFPKLFSEIERLTTDADTEVRELAIVGLLEDIQNELLHEKLNLESLRSWMGPETSQAWNELVVFWRDIETKKTSGQLPHGPFEAGIPEVVSPELKRILRSLNRPRGSDSS